jgi:hypothetical protein
LLQEQRGEETMKKKHLLILLSTLTLTLSGCSISINKNTTAPTEEVSTIATTEEVSTVVTTEQVTTENITTEEVITETTTSATGYITEDECKLKQQFHNLGIYGYNSYYDYTVVTQYYTYGDWVSILSDENNYIIVSSIQGYDTTVSYIVNVLNKLGITDPWTDFYNSELDAYIWEVTDVLKEASSQDYTYAGLILYSDGSLYVYAENQVDNYVNIKVDRIEDLDNIDYTLEDVKKGVDNSL